MQDWPRELPPEFGVAVAEFNRGDYFACHETLETLWRAERGSVRELYQGVLQVAVGGYHLVARANWVGAVNKLEAGARRLERAEPGSRYGVDWTRLIADADRLQAHLRALGREHIAQFDRALLPTIRAMPISPLEGEN